MVFNFDRRHTSKDFQAALRRIVHEDHGDTVVVGCVADCHILPISAEGRPAHGLGVQYPHEARWAPTMLHMRPAGGRHRSQVEAVPASDEGYLLFRQARCYRVTRYAATKERS
jgi:hypothetical protein